MGFNLLGNIPGISSDTPFFGSMAGDEEGKAKVAAMGQAAGAANAYRPQQGQNYINMLGHIFNAYNGSQGALQAMYGTPP